MVFKSVALEYLSCPVCDVEVPMGGDEEPGAEVHCPYCESPLKVSKDRKDVFFLRDDS